MTWNTDHNVLDPNLTAVALRGRALPADHYVQVRAWERRRAIRRVVGAWIEAAVLAGALAGAALLVYAWGWR